MRSFYCRIRKDYHRLKKEKKAHYISHMEQLRVINAERQPHRFLHCQQEISSCPIDVWENHFNDLYAWPDTVPERVNFSYVANQEEAAQLDRVNMPISEVEVMSAIHASKNRKSPGPDKILNEHLKQTAELLCPLWVVLMNECFLKGNIPSEWHQSIVKVLFKGK